MRTLVALVLGAASMSGLCQQIDAPPDAAAQSPADATTLDPVLVTAPRLRPEDLYRSRPPERTPPNVFDHAWREPVNLKKIGDEGGVVPILVRYASRQVTKGARKISGWKAPVQAAIARPPPLDDTQMRRAAQLTDAP